MDKFRIPSLRHDQTLIRVGIPRAFLYYRYKTLWSVFFRELDIETVYSEPTNRKIEEEGNAAAIDEMCLAMKIYLGHVESLIGKCDYILVPRIVDFGIRRVMCVSFQGLPDIVRNVFHNKPVKILTYNVQVQKKLTEDKAMIEMAQSLGVPAPLAKKAYKIAAKAQQRAEEEAAKKADELYRSDGLKIVVAAHSYVLEDEYIGKPVMDYLKKEGVTVIRADAVDHKAARNASAKLSPTLKWELSREMVGSLCMHYNKIDGVILLSAYPCALDSMVNDMLIRKNEISHIPMLQMTLDAQTGTAGVETRLESFLDIIKMRRSGEATA